MTGAEAGDGRGEDPVTGSIPHKKLLEAGAAAAIASQAEEGKKPKK